LHDVGCALVPRYDDAHRLVRHAEASALLLEHVLADSAYIERAELTLLMYAVAAHTHYLRPTDVKDKNGEPVGVIQPYPDMAGDKPFYPVWLARWADRLDTNGPCHVGRHYFTLVKEHHDFDGKNFYTLDFEGQMRPLIRTDEERGKDARTMAEHLLMYAGSQNNASPYGKHDFGEMVRLRDSYRRRLELIVREMIQPKEYSDIERRKILESWNRFLTGNIEPSDRGLHAAEKLARMFNDLPREAAGAWAHVFRRCLQQYLAWSAEAVFDLTEISREFGMHFDRETYLTLVPAFEID